MNTRNCKHKRVIRNRKERFCLDCKLIERRELSFPLGWNELENVFMFAMIFLSVSSTMVATLLSVAIQGELVDTLLTALLLNLATILGIYLILVYFIRIEKWVKQ